MKVPTSEIREKLNRDLEKVLDRYWPGWVKFKGNAYPAFVKATDPGSFVVYLKDGRGKGERRGKWFRRARAIGGDEINLVSYGASGEATHTDYPLAFREAAEILGIEGVREETAEEKAAREKREAEAKAQREEQERLEREDSIAGAKAIWRQCQDGAGTLAEVYFAARGLEVALIDWTNIRFHPALWHPFDERRWPAAVARAQDLTGRGSAVWCIYLRADGRDKAPLGKHAKLGRGAAAGAAVRLGGEGPEIATCEGLETGLGVRELLRARIPVWPCLSTSGLIGFEPPPSVTRERIFPDGDKGKTYRGRDRTDPLPPGQIVPPPGREAAQRGAANRRRDGYDVIIEAEPPPGRDYLDALLATKRAA